MNRVFNWRLVLKVLGGLQILESLIIMSCCLVAFAYNESDWIYFVETSVVSLLLGLLFLFLGRHSSKIITKREGSVIVTAVWILFSFVGMLPFVLSGSIPSVVSAYFETMSGFTTTGATILTNIESLSHSILYWRSLTHWIGGLGIVVISLALLPMFGFSGLQLFGAESTGPTKEKIHPKITGTAKRLFLIYIILTFSEILLLVLGGMSWFDAVCQSYGTIATGGFSTKEVSIAYWTSPYIQYVIIIFMFLSGVNFNLYYFAYLRKWDQLKRNDELRMYAIITLAFTILISLTLFNFNGVISFSTIEKAFRDGLFQIVSILTTTGYCTVDYMKWMPCTWVVILIAMIIGASAGSTAGGVKVVRIVIVFKYCYYEFKRMVHPNAVIPVTCDGTVVKMDVVTRTFAFLILYLAFLGMGWLFLSFCGINFLESLGCVATCLGCVGPGFGAEGPAGSFSLLPDYCKWFLSFVMLVGRLELFTVLLLFTPVFWKK